MERVAQVLETARRVRDKARHNGDRQALDLADHRAQDRVLGAVLE